MVNYHYVPTSDKFDFKVYFSRRLEKVQAESRGIQSMTFQLIVVVYGLEVLYPFNNNINKKKREESV